MKKRVVTALLAAAAVMAASAQDRQAPPAGERLLERRVAAGRAWETTATVAFMLAVNDARLPGGVVAIASCGAQPKYVFAPAGPTARDAFDAIPLTDARYKWEVDEGVVNLLPYEGAPPFLGLRVAAFKTQNARTVHEALGQLMKTPEVERGVSEHGIGSRLFRGGIGYYVPPEERAEKAAEALAVDLKGVTLREALNAIARAHGTAVWQYAEHRCGSNAFTLEFFQQ